MNNLQFAPLRSLDDFFLGAARFQLPNFGDYEKWGNRVVKNLLYYQTNYFILAAAELVLIALMQPGKIFVGLIALAAVVVALFQIYGPNKLEVTKQLQQVNKYAVMALLLGIAYIFLYLFDAVLLVMFAVFTPVSSKFYQNFVALEGFFLILITFNLLFRYFLALVTPIKESQKQAC